MLTFLETDLNNMTEQLNEMFKDISGNLAIQGITEEELENLSNQMNSEDSEDGENIPKGFCNSYWFNIFRNDGKNGEEKDTKTKKQTKEEKKQNKKLKTLYTYGVNLTNKAKTNEIDRVIGREKRNFKNYRDIKQKNEK